MKTNQEYKNAALAALKGHWAPAIVCTIVFMLVAIAVSMFSTVAELEYMSDGVTLVVLLLSMLLSVGVTMPLQVGYMNAYRDLLSEGDDALTRNMFGSYARWGHNALGMFLMGLFTFLWMLLLIIPGIVKAFAYAMTPYILVDKPELSANEAINLSCKMMKGHKFDYFWLCLSFIGWIILGAFTFGIGYFWLMPYMYTSFAGFYQDVKAEYESKIQE